MSGTTCEELPGGVVSGTQCGELPSLDLPAIAELAELRRWVVWRYAERGGKRTKEPVQVNGRLASSTDSTTWSTFADCAAAFARGVGDGLGVVLNGDGLVGCDLDHVIDDAGALAPWAEAIVAALESYTEVSPSGRGLRIFARGALPAGRRKRGHVEMYEKARYLTVTGRHWPGTPEKIEERTAALARVHAEWLGGASKARKAPADDDTGEWKSTANFKFDAAKLDALLENDGLFAATWRAERADLVKPTGEPDWSRLDDALLVIAASAGWSDDEMAALLIAFGRKCGRLQKVLRRNRRGELDYVRRTVKDARGKAVEHEARSEQRGEADELASPHADVRNARRIAEHFGEDLRFVPGIGWLAWEGRFWERDTLRAHAAAQRLGRIISAEAAELNREAAACDDPKWRKELLENAEERNAWAKASEMHTRIVAALAEARPLLALDIEQLDADPLLFNASNGSVDLRTGTLRPHRREDYLTRCAPVHFDPTAECPRFKRFLKKVFPKRKKLIQYVQRLVGYCLTGCVSEQVFFFLYGDGANGKSALIAILEALLGPYAIRAVPDLLTTAAGDRHLTELADLMGARLVICSEVERGRQWAAARVKMLTGERKVRARRMRQDPIEFWMQGKLVVMANTKPRVEDGGVAFWRRLRLLPFMAHFRDKQDLGDLHVADGTVGKANPRIADEIIAAELSGILVWAIEGLAAWRKHGLGVAPEITEAVAQYRREAAHVEAFLADCCTKGSSQRVRAGEIFVAFEAWCKQNDRHGVDARDFKIALAELGYDRGKINGSMHWKGLTLRSGLGVVGSLPA